MYTLIIEDRSGNIADEISFEQGSYTIGRVEGNDIILPSNAVSRTHARIFVSQGRCFINDLGSANGVIVDGEQIGARHELRNAAQIRIGDYTLYLEHAQRGGGDGNDVLRTHIVAPDKAVFKLVRVGDMFSGEEFSLTEMNNTVGRTDDNFILLSDPSISRNHAHIVNEGMMYRLADLGSSNGTRLNGKPVKSPMALRSGDEVEFGNVRFVFAPGNQRVDTAAYAKRKGGGGLVTYLVLGLIVVVVLGIVVFVVLKLGGGDEDESKGKDESAEVDEQPEVDLQSQFDAAAQMANQQKWGEARELLGKVMAADPAFPGAEDLQKRVIRESTNQGLLDQGDTLLTQQKDDEAKELFEKIAAESIYYARAQKKLAQINSRLAKDKFLAGKKACDKKPSSECVAKVCESLELDPEAKLAREYLKGLKGKKALKDNQDLKDEISACLK